jgi:hypothetical protein
MARLSFVRTLGLSVPFVLAVGACGGSSEGGGGPASVPFSSLAPKLADAVCTTAETCLGPIFTTLINSNDCTGRFTTSIEEGSFSLIQAAIDAGTIKYDGTKVQDCLDAISATGCAFLGSRISVLCASALAGTKAGGAACTFSAECAPGMFCKMDQCPGACTQLLADGAACAGDDECRSGSNCDDKTKVCKQAVSIQLSGAEGASCDPSTATLCQNGLVCALASATGWTCEQPATGTTCHRAIPEGCPDGQYCKLDANSLSGTCTAMPAIGSACAPHSMNDDSPACPKDSVCSLGTCKAYVSLGSPCADDIECYSEACVSGKCQATKCAQ